MKSLRMAGLKSSESEAGTPNLLLQNHTNSVRIDSIKILEKAMDKFKVLKAYFGYTSFRGGQEQLIDAALEGRDVMGIMPTGGGKSICYQIPALMMAGITLVISPLISLMKDQVAALKNVGVPAAYVNSSLTYSQLLKVYENIGKGVYKIIYVAPERLQSDGFEEIARGLPISMVAVDEAHCVSQWGNDFRPSYLRIPDFIEGLPKRPVLTAFTATATEMVREDVEKKLRMREPVRVVTGFDRPNLKFTVEQPKSRSEALLKLVKERKSKSGIIYCMTRNNVEKVCELLLKNGISATRYHAGLEDGERQQNQDDFVYDRRSVIVATNAFGMGIDKSNVSFVIHYNMPLSLEAYYQEAGRAGRDGSPAECILLYSSSDIHTAKTLIEFSEDSEDKDEEAREEKRRRDYQRLNRMIEYCKTTNCLRGNILDHFGQEHSGRCEHCGNCETVFSSRDVTVEAQKILSCIKRIYDHLGYYVGITMLVKVLCGSEEGRITELGLQKVSTYSVMKGTPRGEVGDMIVRLADMGYIFRDEEYGTLRLTELSRAVLYDGERVSLEYREAPPKTQKKKEKTMSESPREELYDVLRRLRYDIANELNVPAYVVFTNAALADMAEKKPTTAEEFLEVSGVGKQKAEKYGEIFMNAIREYLK